jgi:Exostosin family
MAQVLLLSATDTEDETDYNRGAFRKLRESAIGDIFRAHVLTNDPAAADVILFAELYGAGPYFEVVRRHPFVKKFREKCFLFCSNDFVIPFLPGIYASIEKRWSSARTCSGFYLGVSENEFVTLTPPANDLAYLYSFVGAVNTAPIRRHLQTLTHPRSAFHDTSDDYQRALYTKFNTQEERDYWRRYATVSQASKFILCPRGRGVSSVRLFDAMRMARVPVIFSDGWVEPIGPRWEQFSIRVSEKDFARVPELLEAREAQASQMGRLARAQWEEWFSEHVCFHHVIEWCLLIKQRQRLPERWARFLPYIQYLRPFHFRHWLRTRYQAWKKTAKVTV